MITLNLPSLIIMKKTNRQFQIPGLCQPEFMFLGRTPGQKATAQGNIKTLKWHLPWQKLSHRVDQLAGLAASHAEVQETLAREADLGYAWGLMGGYTQQLQLQV